MNIGDLFFDFRGEAGPLVVDARKAGEAAGFAAGATFATSFQGRIKASAGGLFGAGFGLEVGRQALLGLERGISNVIDAIPGMIEDGKQFALTVDDIADKTGASAEAASRFAGSLQYLGISTAGLGLSLKSLSQDIVQNQDKLNKLGIATRDSNGNLLDTITVLNNVRSYLSGAADGAAKLTLASDLLGRGAGTLVDYLNLTDEQAAALNKTLDELGVTIGEDARRAAESLAREQNLLGLAFQGFANILFTEVAPTVRAVIGGITTFIKTHGAEIRETIVSMTQAVTGFIAGLIGADAFTPFQAGLDALAGSGGNVTLSFEQWAQQMGLTIPTIEKTTTAAKANTTAIDAQIKALNRATDAEHKRTDAALAAIDAQIAQLDLSEQQLAIEERRHSLNEQLNEAQLDLIKAQGGTDANAISAALDKITDIKADQAENERRLGVAAQRDALELQKTEIQAKADARDEEIADLKAQLQEQRDAIKTVNAGQVSDNRLKLKALKAQYDTYLSEQTVRTKDHVGLIEARFAGDPKTGTGLGGAIAKAFNDGKAAGETFRTFITEDLLPAVQGILDVFRGIKGLIDEIADNEIWKFLNQPIGLPGTVGEGKRQDGGDDIRNNFWKGWQQVFGSLPEGVHTYGMGGVVPGVMGMPQLAVVHGGEVITPTGNGATPIIRIEVGGEKLIDYFDERLVYRHNR